MRFLPLLFALLLAGCASVDPWETTFQAHTEVLADPVERVELLDGSRLAPDLFDERLEREIEHGAALLGASSFLAPSGGEVLRAGGAGLTPRGRSRLEAFARSIGADVVHFRIDPSHTRAEMRTYTRSIPTHETVHHRGTIDGKPFRATTTATGWTHVPETYTVERQYFRVFAAYLRSR